MTTANVANIALVEMGADMIVALTDQSKTAKTINLVFEIARDYVLRSHDWPSLTERGDLVDLEDNDWETATAYEVGDYVISNDYVYICTTGGTSGATDPTGTGTEISDDTCIWSSVLAVPTNNTGFDYMYLKPEDCVKIRRIGIDGDSVGTDEIPGLDYSLEGSVIYCQSDEATIKYTRQETDPDEWDESIVELLVLKLIEMTAVSILGNPEGGKASKDAMAQYLGRISALKGLSTKGSRERAPEPDLWIDA
jgi:hypothetical protein